ncbi:hypothetical protein [Mycobacterium heckeshornense]|uniref:hypothetical protein n=1 Tax=Mycobacterium heckeshornense TaxID=110505 RepID=UPI00194162F2|nr:hypothetical protein [Mycobacterium heckeshornense]
MNQQIVDRYIRDIWPAMSAYNADHAQAGEAAKQFFSVVDPNLAGDQLNTLRSAAQGMGRQGEYDARDQTSHYNDGLTLGHVDVQSVKNGVAALNVCYTYNHFWYVNADNTQHAPGASEATVQLANVNNTWYLRTIMNDHVVADCPSAKA